MGISGSDADIGGDGRKVSSVSYYHQTSCFVDQIAGLWLGETFEDKAVKLLMLKAKFWSHFLNLPDP